MLRLQLAVEVAAPLARPIIVAAFDACEDLGVHFLAMEFIDGRDLEALVNSGGPANWPGNPLRQPLRGGWVSSSASNRSTGIGLIALHRACLIASPTRFWNSTSDAGRWSIDDGKHP